MNRTRSAFALLASALTIASAPALAGNYAEGDPRPQALPTQASAAEVAAQTREWLASAPTVGYPEGDARASVQVGQKSRAQVQAEAVAWVASGLSQIAYGEAGADTASPAYKNAAQAYAGLRSSEPGATRLQ